MQSQSLRGKLDLALQAILRMSRTPANYWGEFILDIPIGILLITLGLRQPDIHPLAGFFTLVVGLFIFTGFEYIIHRWLFHGSFRIMVEGHRAHHENPQGYDGLPFFLPALVLLSLVGLLSLVIPGGYAYLLIGALAFGYTIYGVGHFLIHHVRFRRDIPRHWAANHLIHHHHPDTNFGVTTPLWDRLFSTRYVRP